MKHSHPHRRQGKPVEVKDAIRNQRYTDFLGAPLTIVKGDYRGQYVYGVYDNRHKAPITSSGVLVYEKS